MSASELSHIHSAKNFKDLEKYFKNWQWIGPGVIMDINLDKALQGSTTLEDAYKEILLLTKYRLNKFDDVIPLKLLEENGINIEGQGYLYPPKCGRFIEIIEKLIRLI